MPSSEDQVGPTREVAVDRIALQDLVASVALATDAGDWEEFLRCFVPGAAVDYGSLGAGPVEEIVPLLQESQAQYQGTMNVVGTHRATVEAKSASAETYVVSHHFRRDGEVSWDDQAGTHYRDAFERTPDGWRVVRRVAQLRWFRSDRCSTGWL